MFLHHSIASYQDWDDFEKIRGGKYIRKMPGIQEKDRSTFQHEVWINVSIIDKNHPTVKGLSDFKLYDEVYGNVRNEKNVKPLLGTDQSASDPVIGWETKFNKSKIIYIQPGHDEISYKNPDYRKLIFQAIKYLTD